MGKDKEPKRERSRSRDRDRKNGEKERGADRKKNSEGGGDTKSSKEKSKAGSRSGDGKAAAKESKSAKPKDDAKESKASTADAKESKSKPKTSTPDAKEAKASKDGKDHKESKDSKVEKAKESKEPKEAKQSRDHKDSKSAKDAADTKESRGHKEAIEIKEAASPEEPRRKDREEAPEASAATAKRESRKRHAAEPVSDNDDCAASCSSSSSGARRKRRRDREVGRSLGGFSMGLAIPEVQMYGPANLGGAIVPVGEKVQGLLQNPSALAFEVARLKQAAEEASHEKKKPAKQEDLSTVLKMPKRLQECLLDPANREQLLARTGLDSVKSTEDGLMMLKASSSKGLQKALGQLRRIAYHCQWGCSVGKVAALLREQPTGKNVHTTVVRLAATSSRLQSFEARLTQKVRKLRIGTQAGACQLVVEGVPGLSRKHCTITWEPEKAACYVQDLSTNGTFFNGKRLPRPPYKSPQDARVRVFHGDELFFRLRSDDAEELGYVINLLELS